MSHSFADEFVGQLWIAVDRGELAVMPGLTGATPEVDRVLSRAFQNRSACAAEQR